MFKHNLKVAFRNLWKYKNQTLISVIGLAVGFTCFAMAALWIRYEMTYDRFHKNADRIYCVNRHDIRASTGRPRSSIPCPVAGYLKSTFPEIANAVTVNWGPMYFEYEGVKHESDILSINETFLSVFDVKIVEGSMDFLISVFPVYPPVKVIEKVAITREKALQMFGNESPVGKIIYRNENYSQEICAVVTGLSKHSNYPFDFLTGIDANLNGNRYWSADMLIEVVPDIDMEAFEKKLYEHEIPEMYGHDHIQKLTLSPLTEIRYKDPNVKRDVKFQHIIIFALAGSLLILCTLFNCLTLFVSRFRMRQRELALRTVYGASGRSLFAMLSVEFLMSLTAAFVSGLVLINILNPYFIKASGVKLELSAIYLESVIYIAGVIVVALTVFLLTFAIFRRRTLSASIRGNKKILRKTSIAVQLIISIVFAFCTLVILKQMYYLHNTSDLGFSFKNRGIIVTDIQPDVMNNKMKQIPEIKETVLAERPLLPTHTWGDTPISNWDGKQGDAEPVMFKYLQISEDYIKFYELELVEGEFLRDDDDEKYVVINESAVKTFGWNSATGKSFGDEFETYVVKGVVKNIYNLSPTIAAKPFYYYNRHSNSSIPQYILFRYEEGSLKTCMEKIKKIVKEESPTNFFIYCNAEEEYSKYLKSENALLVILTVVSTVCLAVCIFGFVSMVSLTCEERRKEIAIRKINGATIKDILDIFFKEHLTLLAVGALSAFPVGYIIMKRWLENYVLQTEMSAWIYLSILLALIAVIVLCVGGRVYKTSRENPVNAIK
jgi:hypothetical protein